MSTHSDEALRTIYRTAAINEAVQLYSGQIILRQGEGMFKANGIATLNWLPKPHLKVILQAIQADTPRQRPKLGIAEIELVERAAKTQAYVTKTPLLLAMLGSEHDSVTVQFGEVRCGSLGPYRRVRFHLPNFRHTLGSVVKIDEDGWQGLRSARFTMKTKEWVITIDSVEMEESVEDLSVQMGYAITHVGLLERTDGTDFPLSDTENILECLKYFLSFCRGSWVSPILLCGEDQAGQVLGEVWYPSKIDAFSGFIRSWLPLSEPVAQHIEELFNGFAIAWDSEKTNEALKLTVEWYLEAIAGQPAKSLILAQAALELLSWTLSVEGDHMLSTDGWSKLPAADKIRILLGTRSIPSSIPDQFDDLKAYAREFNIPDGPGVFVDIRNILVHADPGRRVRIKKQDHALIDAQALGLWYLDLLILKTCGYKGRYSNRLIRGKYLGQEIEMVPWQSQ